MFCEKCGSMMKPQGDEFVCKNADCGYRQPKGDKKQIVTTKSTNKETTVIEDPDNIATLPKTRETCPKCGYTEAYYVLRQTRSADEPETRMFRCCKCNHSWREY